MNALRTPDLRRVRADINYIRNPPGAGDPPLTFVTEDESRSTMVTLPGTPMWIEDMRGKETSLDREGFVLLEHHSAVPDFHRIEEDPAIDALYIEEIAALVKRVTGATAVLLQGGGKKRYGKSATDRLTGLKNALPALYPHGDTTAESAAMLTTAMMAALPGLDLADVQRWAHINIWRPITPVPHDYPLAVCDARSVDARDHVPVIAHTETRSVGTFAFETSGYLHNPAHRWCWFSDMTPDEVLMFKTHDTDPARARQVAHNAFRHPHCPPDAPTRGSVEMRALAVFV